MRSALGLSMVYPEQLLVSNNSGTSTCNGWHEDQGEEQEALQCLGRRNLHSSAFKKNCGSEIKHNQGIPND